MKIRIGDQIIDPEEQPVAIMFRDDNERQLFGAQILGIKPKAGPRVYAMYPAGHPLHQDPEHLEVSLKLAGYVQL